MAYDYVTANNIQTDIITMQIEHIKKLSLIGTNLKNIQSKQSSYRIDAQTSGFKI